MDFLLSLATHPSFQDGDVSTDFIPDHHNELFPPRAASKQLLCQVCAAEEEGERGRRRRGMCSVMSVVYKFFVMYCIGGCEVRFF